MYFGCEKVAIKVQYAELLELADRHDSGSCVGNDVRVQVPYSALYIIEIRQVNYLPFIMQNKREVF